ncbi:hypothetical protein DF185_18300 [Marinifilum breve]|uniref:Tetratricopeptide repeat protein n=1 Tax=Marinifilum breve TaxID=2184082 RepID=A0A2V3ZTD6_9BACT|nr:hypothetical protein [Marinifilum breve]PXX96979.1 hypothetical protein DF185_18300 [Marinifilum breve]
MKTLILNFFLIALLSVASAQKNQELNYINYHTQLNQAKLLIAQSKYDKALEIHQNVFRQYPKHFYKDVHNACVSAIKCKKNKVARNLAEELVSLGYQLEEFQKNAFKDFRNSKEWKGFLKTYPKLRLQYESGLNQDLREKYHQLYLEDQKVASNQYGYGEFKNDSAMLALSKRLKEYYKEDGIPDFIHQSDSMYTKYYILYRHYFGMKNNADNTPEIKEKSGIYKEIDALNWKKILLQELSEGNIDPQFYSNAVMYNDYSNPFGKAAIKIDFDKETVSPFMSLKPEQVAKKNANRLAIGLMPLSDDNKEILANTWYAKYPFKAIKDSISKTKNASLLDKIMLKTKVELQVYNSFPHANQDEFFIDDFSKINEKYNHGFKDLPTADDK